MRDHGVFELIHRHLAFHRQSEMDRFYSSMSARLAAGIVVQPGSEHPILFAFHRQSEQSELRFLFECMSARVVKLSLHQPR